MSFGIKKEAEAACVQNSAIKKEAEAACTVYTEWP